MTAEPMPTYQLKIALRGTSPPIWRRVTLPADTSLGCLHDRPSAQPGFGHRITTAGSI